MHATATTIRPKMKMTGTSSSMDLYISIGRIEGSDECSHTLIYINYLKHSDYEKITDGDGSCRNAAELWEE
jgi:hypothetical protein